MSRPSEPTAELIARAESGDAEAKNALFAALYQELHRLAQGHLRRVPGRLTLSTTTLLHEAYLGIAQRESVAFPDRNRFLGYAARAMRGLIVDYVRQRRALKRGGELVFVELDAGADRRAAPPADLDRLNDALGELGKLDPALAELVDLKFFCGFSLGEIAALRGVSERTVQRDWAKARLVLHDALGGE